jgi:hypothetical protein
VSLRGAQPANWPSHQIGLFPVDPVKWIGSLDGKLTIFQSLKMEMVSFGPLCSTGSQKVKGSYQLNDLRQVIKGQTAATLSETDPRLG